MRRQTVPTLALIVGLLLWGCGAAGGQATPTPSPTATPSPSPSPTPGAPSSAEDLRAIVVRTGAVSSAHIEYEIKVAGSATMGDRTLLSGSGDYTTGERPRSQMTMDMSTLGLGSVDVVGDGAVMYLRGPALSVLDPQGRWIRIDTASKDPKVVAMLGSLQAQRDPAVDIYLMLGLDGAIRDLGPTTIDGSLVHHVAFSIDLDAAVDQAPADVRGYLNVTAVRLRDQGVSGQLSADVWSDTDGRIRRAEYRFDLSPLRGGGTMILTYNLSAFGRPLDISPPGLAAVVDVTAIDLSALAGASPEPTTPAPTAPAIDAAAVERLEAEIDANPRDTAAMMELGDLYYTAGDYQAAATWMRRILKIDAANVDARLALGASLFNQGDLVGAKQAWTEVLKRDPRNVEAYYDLGFLALSQPEPDYATVETMWRKVISLSPGSELANTVQRHLDDLAAASQLP